MSDPKADKSNPKHDVVHLPNSPDSGTITNAELAKIVAAAVSEALKVAIPAAAVGINAAQNQANNTSRESIIREANKRTKRCPICGLPESACGGAFKKDAAGNDIIEKNADGGVKYDYELNHVKEYVGPKDVNLFKWYQGQYVNGVRFCSSTPSHRIWIPKKSDILTACNAWEINERELSQKRTAEGQGAGSVGPGGARQGDPRAIGWR